MKLALEKESAPMDYTSEAVNFIVKLLQKAEKHELTVGELFTHTAEAREEVKSVFGDESKNFRVFLTKQLAFIVESQNVCLREGMLLQQSPAEGNNIQATISVQPVDKEIAPSANAPELSLHTPSLDVKRHRVQFRPPSTRTSERSPSSESMSSETTSPSPTIECGGKHAPTSGHIITESNGSPTQDVHSVYLEAMEQHGVSPVKPNYRAPAPASTPAGGLPASRQLAKFLPVLGNPLGRKRKDDYHAEGTSKVTDLGQQNDVNRLDNVAMNNTQNKRAMRQPCSSSSGAVVEMPFVDQPADSRNVSPTTTDANANLEGAVSENTCTQICPMAYCNELRGQHLASICKDYAELPNKKACGKKKCTAQKGNKHLAVLCPDTLKAKAERGKGGEMVQPLFVLNRHAYWKVEHITNQREDADGYMEFFVEYRGFEPVWVPASELRDVPSFKATCFQAKGEEIGYVHGVEDALAEFYSKYPQCHNPKLKKVIDDYQQKNNISPQLPRDATALINVDPATLSVKDKRKQQSRINRLRKRRPIGLDQESSTTTNTESHAKTLGAELDVSITE